MEKNGPPAFDGPQAFDGQPVLDEQIEKLVACPFCDVLHYDVELALNSVARCHRCHTVLYATRQRALTRIVMYASTATVLMTAAIFFPFLELKAGGFSQRASVFDAILAFSNASMLPLSIAIAALIVIVPTFRLLALIYTLAPMAIGWRPPRLAVPVMRWAEAAQPWAMSEIFVVGVAVALVKIAAYAKISTGPAFWALAALVLVTALKDNIMCKLTIWKTLEQRRNS